MASSNPEWSLLPDGILVEILGCFETLRDFFAFRSVCCSWRSAASPSPHTLSSQSPLLILFSQSSSRFVESILHIATRRICSFRLPWANSPYVNRSYSHGQLITQRLTAFEEFDDPNIVLSDLFTGARVHLPPHLPVHPHIGSAARVVISARPDSSAGCRVVLFRDCRDPKNVKYLSVGDDRWTVASSPHEIVDMMFHQGELFALNKDLDLLRVELMGGSLVIQKLWHGGIARTKGHSDFRLCQLDGVMFLVVMKLVLGRGVFPNEEFDVFLWNSEEEKWKEIRDLGGDKSLFFSRYGNAVLFPVTGLELRNNCVYSVNHLSGHWDGFSLTDRSWGTVNIDDANLLISRSYSTV